MCREVKEGIELLEFLRLRLQLFSGNHNIRQVDSDSVMSIYTRLHETGTLDDMVSCPYVPAHVMSANRFIIHVVKCRKVQTVSTILSL